MPVGNILTVKLLLTCQTELFIIYASRVKHVIIADEISVIVKYWEWNVCINIKICKCLVSNWTNTSNFHPLEVVGRGSETQLQVGESINNLI